jgi:hypothetical protein
MSWLCVYLVPQIVNLSREILFIYSEENNFATHSTTECIWTMQESFKTQNSRNFLRKVEVLSELHNSIQFNFIQNPFDPDTGCNVQAIGYRLSHVSNVCSNY